MAAGGAAGAAARTLRRWRPRPSSTEAISAVSESRAPADDGWAWSFPRWSSEFRDARGTWGARKRNTQCRNLGSLCAQDLSRRRRWRPYARPHERSTGDGDRDRVRHLGRRAPARQPDGGEHPPGQRLRDRHPQGPPRPVGLRGGVAAARRPRVRHVPRRRRPQPAHRRGPRPGQRHPHQRRPAVRRPRPPGVLHARVHQPDGHRRVGQGGGADRARRHPVRHDAAARATSCSTRTTPTTRAPPTAPTRTTWSAGPRRSATSCAT